MIPVDAEKPEPVEQHGRYPCVLVDVEVGQIGSDIDDRRTLAGLGRRCCTAGNRQFLAGRNLALRKTVLVDEGRIEIRPDLRLPEEVRVKDGKQRRERNDGNSDHPRPALVPAMSGKEGPERPGGKEAEPAGDRAADQPEETGDPVEHALLLAERQKFLLSHMCLLDRAQHEGGRFLTDRAGQKEQGPRLSPLRRHQERRKRSLNLEGFCVRSTIGASAASWLSTKAANFRAKAASAAALRSPISCGASMPFSKSEIGPAICGNSSCVIFRFEPGASASTCA